MKLQRNLLGLAAVILIVGGIVSSGVFGLNWGFINRYLKISVPQTSPVTTIPGSVKIETEESVVIDVVKKATPTVVTIGITQSPSGSRTFQINPFNPFAPFQPQPSQPKNTAQNIGSGFIVNSSGLIVTNKHVVSDTQAKYKVITSDDKTYDVSNIYRDPANDLAVLKINGNGLPTVTMGDSKSIQVGQMAIAIGTALGEFRSTVTTGVVSGIGRGITAGSPYEGFVERLDNVIQTSAAINPGNSGGPLFNSAGQVIGINTAVSSEGQNIGFAIPIDIIKEALNNFNQTGQFNRPYLGVRYKTVTKELAVLNEMPEGAYVVGVVDGGPAAKAGLEAGDVIVRIDNVRLSGNTEVGSIISKKKIGDSITLTVWRNGKQSDFKITLGNQAEQ